MCLEGRRRERHPQSHPILHSSQKGWGLSSRGQVAAEPEEQWGTPWKICSDKLFALNISRFINQSDPRSLIETRYQKAHFQLQSWQKPYLGSWPRCSVTRCFRQVGLLSVSSLGYSVLSCSVRLSELKQALIWSSQAECSVLGLSDGAAKQSIIRHGAEHGPLLTPAAQSWASCTSPWDGALPAAALATRSPLVAERVQQWCWPQFGHRDHSGAQVASWFPSVQISSAHPPLSAHSWELAAPPFAAVSSHLLLFSFPVHKRTDGPKWGEQTFNSSNFLQEKSALCLIWAAPWVLCLHL